jgi:Bacterial aa3 type cytochrome c oxidase subunit IV
MAHPVESSSDFADHRRSYEGFLRLAVIAVFLILAHVVALAIGGLTHMWFLAFVGVGVSIIAAVIGAAVQGLDWKPGAVVLILLLLTLLLVTH